MEYSDQNISDFLAIIVFLLFVIGPLDANFLVDIHNQLNFEIYGFAVIPSKSAINSPLIKEVFNEPLMIFLML